MLMFKEASVLLVDLLLNRYTVGAKNLLVYTVIRPIQRTFHAHFDDVTCVLNLSHFGSKSTSIISIIMYYY